MAYGSSLGADPNSVSVARAKAIERQLERGAARISARGSSPQDHDGRPIVVKTYVHVLKPTTGPGGATPQMVRDQVQVLNRAYAGGTSRWGVHTPFRFKVVGVDVTRKTTWYNWPLTEDYEETPTVVAAKKALHRGSMDDLNVYFANLGGGLLGYATFPFEGDPSLDGVAILDQSLPGGDAAPYNEGDTATHEIGHWLGLFHTFENGCTYPGDYVKDTPYQLDGDNVFFCGDAEGFGNPDDTCAKPGKDPVHNFMSYGDDPCLDRFTHGQSWRMIRAWNVFRAGQ
jgi:hypothetical protein